MWDTIRPRINFLNEDIINKILTEAYDLLGNLGLEIANPDLVELLRQHGATVEPVGKRVQLPAKLIDRARESAPSEFSLYDREGMLSATLGGDRIHYTPGSAAINILDNQSKEIRAPLTQDFVRYVKLVQQLPAIDYQSTAFIPSDVHELISDSYRLYLALIYGPKPVVTGAFTIEAFTIIRDLLLAVRENEETLAEKPLAILSCCPTAPLKWSDVTSQNVVDCARYKIPVEYISMPLTGFVSPGTLIGSIVQHTAETLSGLVISQIANPGTPILWGGSPAIFDYRFETTPMGAIETQMIDCAFAQIGKFMNLPTQAYISLSDAKRLDAQAGLESASGAVLAALAGINSISGPGMLDFESCQSLEKLVVDNEICAYAKRLVRGIDIREGEFPSRPHFEELLKEGHLLIADHTRKWIKDEVYFPNQVIDRATRARYYQEGGKILEDRAAEQVEKLVQREAITVAADIRSKLDEIMLTAARSVGMNSLPVHG